MQCLELLKARQDCSTANHCRNATDPSRGLQRDALFIKHVRNLRENNFNGEPIRPELISSMCAAIARRGPDDMGIFLSEADGSGVQAGLGHQRLSIIDLSPAGRQPMANEDGTIRLTYNGEIYNYKDLRRELEAKGHRFRSESDTEVVIHLYEEERTAAASVSTACSPSALGREKQAALAVPGPRRHQAAGLRVGRGRLLFASEIKALLADRGREAGARPRRPDALSGL